VRKYEGTPPRCLRDVFPRRQAIVPGSGDHTADLAGAALTSFRKEPNMTHLADTRFAGLCGFCRSFLRRRRSTTRNRAPRQQLGSSRLPDA